MQERVVEPPSSPSSAAPASALDAWFDAEVRPHEPGLRAFVQGRVPEAEVDDVIQESFLKTLLARASGRLTSTRGFLYTVSGNLARDRYRQRARAPSAVPAEEVAATEPDAAEAASLHQELDVLRDAIERLPLRCRQVLKLRRFHGLSHREVAVRLGISERTVNVQLGHAMRRCADHLRAHGVEPPRPADCNR